MTKIEKHPKFHFDKIRDFDKIIPEREFYDVFNDELAYVYNSLKNPRSKISKHLKKYFIIRLVTMIESYLKYLAAHLVDVHKLKISNLFQEGTISMQIKDLEEIKKKEFTIGKMVAISFNFQDMREADWVFSRLLGVKFFDILEEYGEIAVRKKLLLEDEVKHFLENKENFFDMFGLRNEIIHSMKTPHKIRRKAEYFWGLWDASTHFFSIALNLAEDIVSFREGKLRDKELQSLFSKKSKKFHKS